jgi:hypothetical protein
VIDGTSMDQTADACAATEETIMPLEKLSVRNGAS